jgi:hypothetical protein
MSAQRRSASRWLVVCSVTRTSLSYLPPCWSPATPISSPQWGEGFPPGARSATNGGKGEGVTDVGRAFSALPPHCSLRSRALPRGESGKFWLSTRHEYSLPRRVSVRLMIVAPHWFEGMARRKTQSVSSRSEDRAGASRRATCAQAAKR